ncbi:hypothetical protein G3545_08715 [Starkeya sp. ORNL1]|uniref:hypothetical protein n=1 Tax=Starkeya sp. ORNL1 TaxID=2709380 RepID=UPI001463A72A|nr:hypothetical protein [Starkeya sp. ORNL1]QJP13732.1 hypothetical protein G3545_08715 [Starkeya sp. ORNL1]
MAQFRNSPPPDWGGWGGDALYYPPNDPLSGGRPGTYFQELFDPALFGQYAPPPPAPPGQFLRRLFDPALFGQNAPQPAPPGRFLPSIGVNLPEPKTVLATRRYDPPPPPLTPLEPPADYTSLAVPKPMVGPQSTERVDGFGATAQRQPGELEPAEGDGVMMNAAAGLAQGVYGTLGAPVDAMTWVMNRSIDGVNYASGADLGYIEDPFLGSHSLARGGTYLGIPDPESVAAVTPAERIARSVGEGAAYMVAPAAMVRGGAVLAARELPWWAQAAFGRANSARELGREAVIGAAAGGTGNAAGEVVPEAWKPTAQVVGGLIGGLAAAGATAPGALARAGRTIRDFAAPPTGGRTVGDATRMAALPVAGESPAQAYKTGIKIPTLPDAELRAFEAARLGSAQATGAAERNVPQIIKNKAAGDAFEADVFANDLQKLGIEVRRQITFKSSGPSGLPVRLDAVGRDAATGKIKLTEMKASSTARLTYNQRRVYPELEAYGGVVVGKGKAPYVGGTIIPPTAVNIIRKVTR